MNKQQIDELIHKYLEGNITQEERDTLLGWYRSVDHNEVVWPESEDALKGRLKNMHQKITDQLNLSSTNRSNKKSFLRPLIAAAIVLFTSSTGLYLFLTKQHTSIEASSVALSDQTIKPGRNKAELKLADGATVVLTDSIQSAKPYAVGNMELQIDNGELSFIPNNKTKNSQTAYHTLNTPKGGQYILNLPDGSKVWLNAESSLTFPDSFTEDKRQIKLQGEAYFTIAKDKARPFIIEAGGLDIEVLGTEFNVNAYPNENIVATTLVEGLVKITKEKNHVILKPSEKNTWNRSSGAFITEKTNVNTATSWKDGYFTFDETNIYDIMPQLARWYNIDVEYKENLSNKVYTGRILKRSEIKEVLNMLELTGTINFEIKGRRVIVMP